MKLSDKQKRKFRVVMARYRIGTYEVEAENQEDAADLVLSGEVDELEVQEHDLDIIENAEIIEGSHRNRTIN